MRVNQGDNIKLDFEDDILTVIGKDTDRGKLYLENCRGDVEIATSDDVEEWPWELRKNAPRIPKGEHVTLWTYESGKDGAQTIIGKCRMVCIVPMRHMPFGSALEEMLKDTCVTEEHLRNYLPCYVWGIQDPVRLPAAVPLSAIGMTRPPQSWQYITPEQAAILERRGNENAQ